MICNLLVLVSGLRGWQKGSPAQVCAESCLWLEGTQWLLPWHLEGGEALLPSWADNSCELSGKLWPGRCCGLAALAYWLCAEGFLLCN